jgi:hypothetical protein
VVAVEFRSNPLNYLAEISLSADPGFGGVESRRAPRERVLLQARVSYAGGSTSFPCLVTQISATGAKIAINDEAAMPEYFQIAIPQRGIDSGARLVWRRAGYAGIAFENVPTAEVAADASQDPNTRLQALEAENNAQRATIEQLTAQLSRFVDGY